MQVAALSIVLTVGLTSGLLRSTNHYSLHWTRQLPSFRLPHPSPKCGKGVPADMAERREIGVPQVAYQIMKAIADIERGE